MDVDDEENHIPEPKERDAHNVGRSGGPKSILEKFPDIPALERSRDTTITSCGVSVPDIREHLLKVIPGLKEYGVISVTFAAENYKSDIDAAVPSKDNSLHKDNINAHYLSSRVRLRREFCAHFKDECTIASADSTNIIRYETLAVSRYHISDKKC